MASSNNLDTLSQDAELPFGHPGRRSDDTPEGFDTSPLMDQEPEQNDTPEGFDPSVLMNQEPEQNDTPDEDGGVVHYAPGESPSVWQREYDCGLHLRPRWGRRLRRLPGAGCRGPRRGQRALGALPPLPAGDLRPERRRVAPSRPETLPALRGEGVVNQKRTPCITPCNLSCRG